MTKPRLLVVDDDKNTLDGLVKILARDGFRVSGVLSGYDALNLFARGKFDIVITDMKLPGMGGLSLIHELRKKEESLAIVVVTAYSPENGAVEATKYGVDYCLTKPVNIPELKLILEKLWERQQLIAQKPIIKRKSSGELNSSAMDKKM